MADDDPDAEDVGRGAGRDRGAEQAARAHRIQQQAQWVDAQVRDAIARGEFDDLPGAGKPIEGLEGPHDPDWWLKGLIERERLSGLGPPAIMLRKEDAELERRLDRESAESEVRRVVEDFNARVVSARRQLLGGPPVVTPTRDVDAEVAAWRERRLARTRARSAGAAPRPSQTEATRDVATPRRRWWRRQK
jgi:hypothetical protein